MKRNAALLILVFFSLFFTLNAVFAQGRGTRAQDTIEIRLASPLPRNSDWGRGLDRIAAEWARVTNNQVRVRVIHDGVEGGDSRMLASLSSDNIQAALFTSVGMAEICPAVMTLSIPFFIGNNEELDLVLEDILPILDNQMSRTNFVAVCWSKGGWVNIFSREPVVEPDSLRRQRLGSSPELRDINTAFRTMGFNLVEAEMVDLGTRLASNVINSIYLIPEALAPMGLHRTLTNMLDMPIAPIMGAIVMNRVTWNKLGAERQRSIVAATQRIIAEFEVTMSRTSANAVSAMQREGLRVNRPNQAQIEMWRAEIDRAVPPLLGTTFDRNVYNQINQILIRARNR
ncbi:MAG: TRAP transporter substrate-binding protein DctP [Treponema sp.]|jgi:TRAP-type C4-dicarboxylate transport system substrate-binding protein|nr:TRAP transporter substrate-binding protein DctP [Treponema sp.]